MSLSLVAYLVDGAALRAVYGSGDAALCAALLALLQDEGLWDEEDLAPAIRDLVNGIVSPGADPDAAAAAVEICCLYGGERLLPDALSALHPEALALLERLPGLVTDAPLPLPLPAGPAPSQPAPLYIGRERVPALLGQCAAVTVAGEEGPAGEWFAAAMEEYRSWLGCAQEEGKDLMLFLQ